MKNRFIVFYTIFASIVFTFSIGFFGYNLYNEYTTNQIKAEKKYNELVREVKQISENQKENNEYYSELLKKAVGETSDYAFIEIKRNEKTVVLFPNGSSKDDLNSKMTKSFQINLNVNYNVIQISCKMYLIHPDSIFYYSRVSFFIILIVTLITIIMIIYLNISGNSSNVISFEEQTSDEESDDIQEDVDEAESNVDYDKETEQLDDTVTESTSDIEKEEQITEKNEIKSEENTKQELPSNEEMPVQLQSEIDNPAGLFNPETGIGWESYLITRLENEINRSTASEIDLSLFIIKLPFISRDSEEFKNVCNYLSIQFQFKDLLFEYKNDSIVALKISMDIDSAINFADKLFEDISNIIAGKKFYIGITSRSIRMVTGERLLLEADQAVEHAIKEPSSPIIAFRVNSEKYHQLMENNN